MAQASGRAVSRAGAVVALRLICEREAAIEAFNAQEYWTVESELGKADGRNFKARLTHLDGKKLGKLDIGTEPEAIAAAAAIEAEGLHVADIQTKQIRENPKPPFTTSTLQQEASRKLGFRQAGPCRLHNGFMKASISAAKPPA